MSTSREKLQATLARLHEELSGVEELDPETRRLLEKTARELQEHLEDESPSTPLRGAAYVGPLQQMLGRFEATNPALYKTVMSLVNALGEMGI